MARDMKAAMEKAGMNTADARLYTTACEAVSNAKNTMAAASVLAIRCRDDNDLMKALSRYYVEHVARDMRGEGMGSEGHICSADNGREALANASQQNEGEGQRRSADKAIDTIPTPSTERNRAGLRAVADKAKKPSPSPVSSTYIAAAKKGAKDLSAKLGWIGDASIPGGPKFVSLRVGDIAGMMERQLSEGAVHARAAIALKMIDRELNNIGQADPGMFWVDILKPETVKAISQATEPKTLKPMAMGWLRGLSNSVQEISDAR